MARTFRTEHPQYPVDALPPEVLTAAFADESWHNEACPRFVHVASGLSVFVDWPELEDRECGGNRFSVGEWTEDGYPFESDNWADVLQYLNNGAR